MSRLATDLEIQRGVPKLDARELDAISKGNCPTCHSRGFVIDHQDGNMLSIECANSSCRQLLCVVFQGLGKATRGWKTGRRAEPVN